MFFQKLATLPKESFYVHFSGCQPTQVLTLEGWSSGQIGVASGIASLFATADGVTEEADGQCLTKTSVDDLGVLTKTRDGCDYHQQQNVSY